MIYPDCFLVVFRVSNALVFSISLNFAEENSETFLIIFGDSWGAGKQTSCQSKFREIKKLGKKCQRINNQSGYFYSSELSGTNNSAICLQDNKELSKAKLTFSFKFYITRIKMKTGGVIHYDFLQSQSTLKINLGKYCFDRSTFG